LAYSKDVTWFWLFNDALTYWAASIISLAFLYAVASAFKFVQTALRLR
jgi:hypothetical protein